jgi:hypothetical protein
MAGSRKMRIKPVPVIILGVVTVAIIAGIGIFAIGNTSDKQQNSSATVSVSKKNLKDSNSTSTEPVKAATTVEIQWEDSAVPVGTSFKVTAIVTPQDTEHALVWSSGNQDVCTIDSEGVVTVRSAGNAAITATVGTVSDSVIIQGIDSVSAGSDRGLPVYTGDSYVSAGQSNGGSNDNSNGNTSTGDSQSDVSSGGSQQGQRSNGSIGVSSGINSSSNISDDNSDISDDNNGGSSDNGSDNGYNYNTDNGSYDNNNGGYDNNSGSHDGASSSDIAGYLPQIGYTQRMSNVYVCEDGDTYYGEIIIQPNVTIIYIKQRSGTFDSMIQSTLSALLPSEAGQVWNNYLSSSSDKTFTVDGRRVRIVTALNGGHSQIVVYN